MFLLNGHIMIEYPIDLSTEWNIRKFNAGL